MRRQITDHYEFNPDESRSDGEFIVYPARSRAKNEQVYIHVSADHVIDNFSRAQEIIAALEAVVLMKADGLVPIVDFIQPSNEDLHIYYVERRPEKSIHDLFEQEEEIHEADALDLFRSLASALAQLHDNGYVHNALSDSCIYVIGRGRRPRVMIGRPEFIAKEGAHVVHPYIPEFGAPELYGEQATTASKSADLYAIGMIAYKLFASRDRYQNVFSHVFDLGEPQQEEVWKNLHTDPDQEIPRLDTIIPDFEPALADLVARLLSRNPHERPVEAGEVRAELEGVSRSTIRPISKQPPPDTAKSRGWWARQSAAMRIVAVVAPIFWIILAGAVGYKFLRVDPAVIAEANELSEHADKLRKEVGESGGSVLGNRDRLKITIADGENAQDRGNKHLEKRDYKDAILAYRDSIAHLEQAQAQLADRQQKARTARDAAAKARSDLEEAGDEDTPDRAAALALIEKADSGLEGKQFAEATNLYGQSVTAFGKARRTALERKGTADDARAAALAARDKIPTKAQARDPNFRKGAAALASAEGAYGRRRWGEATPLFAQGQGFFETAAANPTIECNETKANLPFVMVPAGSYEIRDGDIARVAARFLGPGGKIALEDPFCVQVGKTTFATLRPYVAQGRLPASRSADSPATDAVNEITYVEAAGFAEWLSKETGETYSLPSLRQWLAAMAFLSDRQGQPKEIAASFFAQPREWLSGDCSAGSAFVGGPHFRDESTKLQCIDGRLRNPQIGFRLILSR